MKPRTRNIISLFFAFCLIGFGIYSYINGKVYWALFDFILGLTNILLIKNNMKLETLNKKSKMIVIENRKV